MKSSADELDDRIQAIGNKPWLLVPSDGCGDADAMSKSLAVIQRTYREAIHVKRPRCDSVIGALLNFRETGMFQNYREARYICAGASLEVSGWCLLEDLELLDKLLFWCRVSVQHQGMRFYACLLQAFWSFLQASEHASAASQIGSIVLRGWLENRRSSLALGQSSKPRWLSTLNKNADLLSEKPLRSYAKGLLDGSSTGLREALADLRTPSGSLLWKASAVAQLARSAELGGTTSETRLPSTIDVSCSAPAAHSPVPIPVGGFARLPSELVILSSPSEESHLRNAARFSLNQSSKSSAAPNICLQGKDGQPADQLQAVVRGGRKRRVATPFSGKVGEYTNLGKQRLDFLFGFGPVVQDMSLRLGASAMTEEGEGTEGAITRMNLVVRM
jgi:hypothetical protein